MNRERSRDHSLIPSPRQRHRHRKSVLILHFKASPVGTDDPVRHGQSEAMGGIWQSVQIFQHIFRYTLSVISKDDRYRFSLQAAGDGDRQPFSLCEMLFCRRL